MPTHKHPQNHNGVIAILAGAAYERGQTQQLQELYQPTFQSEGTG